MSSYPLAALTVHPPEQPDTLGSMGKYMQLKALMDQQSLAPLRRQQMEQEVQTGQMQLQQNQQSMKDQQAMTAAMQGWDPKTNDYDALSKSVLQNGGSATAASHVQQMGLTLRKSISELAKQDAETGSKNLDTFIGKHKAVGDILSGVENVPDEQLHAHSMGALQELVKGGIIDPQAAQQLAQGIQQTQDPKVLRQQIDVFAKSSMGAKAAAEQAKTEQEGEKLKLDNQARRESGGLTEQERQTKYESILQNLKAHKPVSQQDLDFATAHEAAKTETSTTSDSLGVQSTNTKAPRGLAAVGRGGAGGTPTPAGGSAKDSLIDLIGNYQADPSTFSRLLFRHPELPGLIHMKYPDWDQTSYIAKAAAMKDLAPQGKTGQQVTSYNTFLRHAGQLWDAVDELKNSGYPDWNKPMNWLSQHSGDPRVASFLAKMQPVQKEYESFLVNNRALYDEDRKDGKQLLNQNQSPQQLRSVLQSIAHTGGARLSETNNSFKRVVGKDIPNLVSPEAASAYNKITGEGGKTGGTVLMRAPNGQTRPVPADQVEHYKSLGATEVKQ